MARSKASRGLAQLRKKLHEIPRTLVPEMSERIGKALLGQVQQQFASGTDPDGKPWPFKKTGGQPLVRTGQLRDSAKVEIRRGSFRISLRAIDKRSPKTRRRVKARRSTKIPYGPRNYAIIVQGPRAIMWRRRHTGKMWRGAMRKVMRAIIKEHTAKLK